MWILPPSAGPVYDIKKLMIIQWIYSPVIKCGNWTSTIYLDWLISHDIQPPCLVRAFSSQPCLITRRYPHNTIWNPMKFHYIPIVVGEISLNPMKSIWLNCLNLTTPPKKSNPYFWWLNPTVSLLFPPLFRPISQWPWHVPQSSSARAVNPIPMSWQPAEPAGSWLRVGCLGLFRGTLW